MTTRRGFLGSILALGAAPAIVRADALMRVVPRDATVLVGEIGRYEGFTFRHSKVFSRGVLSEPLVITGQQELTAHYAQMLNGILVRELVIGSDAGQNRRARVS